MIKVENIKVFNFEGALRGLRNPLESWDRSDSIFIPLSDEDCFDLDCFFRENFSDQDFTEDETDALINYYVDNGFSDKIEKGSLIGPKDLKLAQRMIGAGTDESKFMRQIFISMDITAPLFWQTFCQ